MVETEKKFYAQIIIAAALALSLLIAPAGAELEIVLDNLSPQPVEPGQDLTLSVTLLNENYDINGVTLTIKPDSHIRLKNDNDRIINTGRIIKYGAIAENYLLHVDSRALSGAYEVEFNAHWLSNDQPREMNKTVRVMVRGAPQLAVSNIKVNPELISPQDMFELAFEVSNEGTGIARDVQVSAVTAGLPFVTDGADTKVIKTLDPGESEQLSYRILVKDGAEISSYSLPLRMDYKDEDGKNTTSQSMAGIKVLGRAKLSIANIKTEPENPARDDMVSVTVRVENSGSGDAKSAKVTFATPLEGNKTAFLGKIKPNDDAPAVFTFRAAESGDIPYSATVEFEDDLGVHTRTWQLNQYVYSRSENSIMASAGILAIAAVTTLFYLARRKKSS